MSKKLIVNADDFGYSSSVNRGIIEAHKNGIVTSTSVLVDSIAANEALELTKFANLSVGLHLVLEGADDVQSELDRQVAKFVSIVGREPDHIDTHKTPKAAVRLTETLRAYADSHGVPVRRLGYAKYINTYFGFRTGGDVSIDQLKLAIDQATDEYNELMCHVGYVDDYLREHSSYSDPREDELKAIRSPEIRQYIDEKGLELVSWRALRVN